MYGSWTENGVLWKIYLRIHLRPIQRFNDVQLLSLSAKSTFKIIHLGDYVLRIDFLKWSNNDDENCNNNSTVNWLVA